MGDADQTIYSSKSEVTEPEKPKRNPVLLFGSIGCVILLCAGLLIAAGAYFFLSDQISEITGLGGGEEAPTVEIATEEPSPTPLPEPTEEVVDTSGQSEPTEEPVVATEEAVMTEPEIGEIVFALDVTDDLEPVDEGDTFEEGVTEVHAIFDHTGIQPDYTWERVWYLDGEEMLRSEEVWGGEPDGTFDYFLDAGGDPFPPGEWELELYVQGELLASGSFTVEPGEEVAAATQEPEEEEPVAEHDADVPEETPTASPTPRPTSPPVSRTYKLVYTKYEGQHNIYISDTNGSSEQFVMHHGAGPSWSSDGTSLFFFGEAGVNIQNRDAFPGVGSCELPGVSDGIVAISVPAAPLDVCQAGSSIFQGPGWNDGTARWANVSPDGNMVAYDARPGGDWRIYFLGTADNQQFKFEIIGEQADWSPDSQKVVYRSGRDGKTGIWISNRDDSGHTNITNNGSDSFPAWSPDGQTIAFHREEGGNIDIYTMNVDGTNIQRLTDAPGPDTLPTYAPNGDIIFRSARSGSWGIWKMSGSGDNQTEIIPNANVGQDWAFSRMDVLR